LSVLNRGGKESLSSMPDRAKAQLTVEKDGLKKMTKPNVLKKSVSFDTGAVRCAGVFKSN